MPASQRHPVRHCQPPLSASQGLTHRGRGAQDLRVSDGHLRATQGHSRWRADLLPAVRQGRHPGAVRPPLLLRSAPCRLSRQSAHHSQQGGPCLTACGGYCVMARHGFARNSPWTLVGSSVEDSATSITMQLTKETLRCEKRISFAMPFCTTNDHSTKTGSGQT